MAEAAPTDHGKTLVEWDFPEYVKYRRSKQWYALMSIAAVGLIVWAVIDNNVLFAIIILICSILMFTMSRREPNKLMIRITEDGIEAGKNFFPYEEIKHFWLFYRPPQLKKLYIIFKTTLRTPLIVPLERQDPVVIRNALLRYLPEDVEQEAEPASDELSRLLKL